MFEKAEVLQISAEVVIATMSLISSVTRLYRQLSDNTEAVVGDQRGDEETVENAPEETQEAESPVVEKRDNVLSAGELNEKLFPTLAPKVLPPIQPKEPVSPAPSYSAFDPPSYQDLHPFAPTPTDPPSPTPSTGQEDTQDAEDSQSAPLVDRNWFPGLPRPPPGVFVQPPRNRSKVERIRYLADFQRFSSLPVVS